MLTQQGQWGYVAASTVTPTVAHLVCQHLGHPRAKGSSSVVPNSRGAMQILHFACPPGSARLSQCSAEQCTNCPANEAIATVRCFRESPSRCPDGGDGAWEAWGGACYLVGRSSLHRGAAADTCRKAGGNLVDVNSQSEHDWLSAMATHASASNPASGSHPTASSYYTAGQLESDLQWRWREQRIPLVYARWWHGWNSSTPSTDAPPSSASATCLVLRSTFSLLEGAAAMYDAGYNFFQAEDCLSNKGFICEAPIKNVGCRDGPGFDYSGTLSASATGKPCLRWDDARVNSVDPVEGASSRQGRSRPPFDLTLLGAHSHCRNPDGSAVPWCYVGVEEREPCDVPLCEEQSLSTQSTGGTSRGRSTTSSLLTPFRPTNSPRITPASTSASSITRRHTTSIIPTILAMMANKVNGNTASTSIVPVTIKTRCRSPDMQCSNSQLCVPTAQLCDGDRNCPAGDDERCVASVLPVSCLCVPTTQLCDGDRNCPAGDDERDCKRFLENFEIFKGHGLLLQLVTESISGRDIAICAKRCLDLPQCKGVLHNESANMCQLTRVGVASGALKPSPRENFYELTTRRSSCVGRLKCDNQRCVHPTTRCDGRDDCGDNSDEKGCPNTAQHPLRLVGGKGGHEGNVQLMVKGEWGHVCDDSFGWLEADRICQDLGFSDAITFTRNNFFSPDRKTAARGGIRFWLDGVSCRGGESSFFQCHSRAIGIHNCGATEVAGVICRNAAAACPVGQFQCGRGQQKFSCVPRAQVCDGVKHCFDESDEDLRLCGDMGVVRVEIGSVVKARGTEALGTVYVKNAGRWGTVCDDGFDSAHARFLLNLRQVVCRSLGYNAGWAVPYARAALGRGKGQVLVDEPLCRGSESSLDECRGLKWGVTDCDHSEDAGVFCSDPESIRLVGGTGPHQGRVEIKLSGAWGTICDDDFDDYDASVICRALGYTNGGIAHKRARFGAGAGIIWLDALDCSGTEASLQECIKRAPGTGDCTHMEDAGVTCYTDRNARTLDLSAVSTRMPSHCGRQSPEGALFTQNLAKIVGGRITSPRETPWSVSLMIREGTKLKHNCGGVIISEDLILTAAHCFKKHPKHNYVIRVGEHDLLANDPGQQDYLIDKLWVHDEFDTNIEFNNDIAVLKVMKKNGRGLVLGSGVVEAVCLPSSDVTYADLRDCTITGWGTLTENAPAVPQRLPRSGAVQMYEMSTCTTSSGYGTFEVSSGMTCAGRLDGRVDTCTGDSGGPLTCVQNGRHVLYGITSWGKGCGRRGQPGMYTKVTKFLRWLNQFV